jgi:hypothetical protein
LQSAINKQPVLHTTKHASIPTFLEHNLAAYKSK